MIASPSLDPSKLHFNGADFTKGSQPGVLVSHVGFAINGENGLKLTIQDVDTKIEKRWLIAKYTLQDKRSTESLDSF